MAVTGMAARDWRELYQQYRGQWVALKEDEMTVISSASTLKEVLAEAARLGYPNPPRVTKMPSDLRVFVG
jgi:uncharacterized protein DUF5678